MSAGVKKIAVPRTAPIVMSAPSHAPRARTREGAGGGVESRLSGIKDQRLNPAAPNSQLSSSCHPEPFTLPVILTEAKDLLWLFNRGRSFVAGLLRMTGVRL